MGIWLEQDDLEGAIGVATVAAIFDDQNTGTLNTAAIALVIQRAEQQVLSWLVGEYPNPTQNAAVTGDQFFAACALDYAVAYAFDRHPEYVRANGKERFERFKAAETLMARVLSARQRPTTVNLAPSNVQSATVDDSKRIIVSSPDGTYNGGDF